MDWMQANPESLLVGSALWWHLRHQWGHPRKGQTETVTLLVLDGHKDAASPLDGAPIVQYDSPLALAESPVVCATLEDSLRRWEKENRLSIDCVAWRPESKAPSWFIERYSRWFGDAMKDTVRIDGTGWSNGRSCEEQAAYMLKTGSLVIAADSSLRKRVREEEEKFYDITATQPKRQRRTGYFVQ
jgi:hypothetical protein